MIIAILTAARIGVQIRTVNSDAWNPRYLAYARSHSRTPELQRAHDAAQWPGGCGAGFQLWISDRWAAWDIQHGRRPHDVNHIRDTEEHDAFTAWVLRYAGVNAPQGSA